MKKVLFITIAIISLPLMAEEIVPVEVGPRVPMAPTIPGANGRTYPQGGAPGGQSSAPQVIYEPPPPVMVDGKKATDMDEDEMKEFLQKKIKDISQDTDTVEFLRVAPGYGLTMTFDNPVSGVIIGDKNLVSYTLNGKLLELAAHQRSGDTTMKLVFGGNKILNYHIFIAPNFVEAQSLIRVSTEDSDGTVSKGPGNPVKDNDDLDIGMIGKVIANYDAMAQEKALSDRTVRRIPIFKKSDITAFQVYYIYLFKGGPAAISFSYSNPFKYPIRYEESKLRIQVGSMQFVPDYVTFQQTTLEPGETTTGFAVLAHPPFSFKQPFELIWK